MYLLATLQQGPLPRRLSCEALEDMCTNQSLKAMKKIAKEVKKALYGRIMSRRYISTFLDYDMSINVNKIRYESGRRWWRR